MDNRAALVLLMVGVSALYWLHNTDKLKTIVETVKAPVPGSSSATTPGEVKPYQLPPNPWTLPAPGINWFQGGALPGGLNK